MKDDNILKLIPKTEKYIQKEIKMNKVFIIGRIIENIEFNFIYRKSKISINGVGL